MSNCERGRLKRALAASLVACAMILPADSPAQVGHAPESSPYRALTGGRWLSLHGGYLGGSAGSAGVGPTDGATAGIRADFAMTAAIDLTASVAAADLGRRLIDPKAGVDERELPPTQQLVVLADGGIVLRLSGRKTWHRMLPYAGLTMGIAIGTKVEADTMGFKFGVHFQTGPQIGLRVHPGGRLFLRLEARDVIWRLKYPPVFFETPEDDPDSPPVLDPRTQDDSEWTHHPVLLIGVGVRF